MKGFLFMLVLFIGHYAISQSQEVPISKSQLLILEDSVFAPGNDTIISISDTVKYRIRNNPYKTSEAFYSKIQGYSNDNKIVNKLIKLLFVQKEAPAETATVSEDFYSSGAYEAYEGLTISGIEIKHVDILEGNVKDTLFTSFSVASKLANKLHVDTWESVIRKSLLFKSGDKIDPGSLADAERIIRQFRFIEDAKIYIRVLNAEEVELILVVKDRLNWGAGFEIRSIDSYRTDLSNRNIVGSGKYTALSWYYQPVSERPHGYEINAGGQNIERSLTNWNVNYTDRLDRKALVANVQKDFISPVIKWGGGIQLSFAQDSIYALDGELSERAFYRLNSQDFWVGRSFALSQQQGSRKNIILTSRLINNRFEDRPDVFPDSAQLFYDRLFSLNEISITSQNYFKSNYIVSFGITEDIPIGFRYSLLYGRDFNDFGALNYYAAKVFWSKYYRGLGYFSLSTRLGVSEKFDGYQNVLKASTDYFSPLINVGRYNIRSFLRIKYTHGNNQPDNKVISLKDVVRDIEGQNITGNGTFAANVESLVFTPWFLYGFRFAPFGYYYGSRVWEDRIGHQSFDYHALGVGLRIKNESLVFDTFEMRVGQFIQAPMGMSPTQFSFRFISRLRFDNMFLLKPTIIPFK